MFQISQNVLVILPRTIRKARKTHDVQEEIMQQNYSFAVVCV